MVLAAYRYSIDTPFDNDITLGVDLYHYATLLPMDVALETHSVVVDVFDGAAIVACVDCLDEGVLDHLYKHGLSAVALTTTQKNLWVLQCRVYAIQAKTNAERIGASSRGVITWLRWPIWRRSAAIGGPITLAILLALIFPTIALGLGALCLIVQTVLRLKLCLHGLPPQVALPKPGPQRESFSILIPLYKEAEILPALVQRLERINYPKEYLQILFLLEAHDKQSRLSLNMITLPDHMRVLTIPNGALRTKPRAMQAAFPFTTGKFIGVYDAEDAPHPNQLQEAELRFARLPELDCLQAPLDIYNAHHGVLPTCFLIEYAMLFRLQNPSLAVRNWPILLGGTSFFIRRDSLRKLGGWDAYNVTEDAELGLRLHNAGLQIQILSRPTLEEAPTRLTAWIKQRSRWLKGFLLTFLSPPDRRPGPLSSLLLLGPVLAAAISLFCLPLWALSFGPYAQMSNIPFWTFTLVAAFSEVVLFGLGWRALSARHLRRYRPALFLMPLYRLLLVPACTKALFEAVIAPIYWDKTHHGG
ncbi:MAG: glycosyltransferase [Pseudomonadota bacterium]